MVVEEMVICGRPEGDQRLVGFSMILSMVVGVVVMIVEVVVMIVT